MIKYLPLLLLAFNCEAKTIKIAVIDTGIDLKNKSFKLCPEGGKDFTSSKEGLQDIHGHGTHVASLIQQYAGYGDYCLIPIKYYLEKASGAENLLRSNEAFKYAFSLKVDFINYSGGGKEPSDIERKLIRDNINTIVISAIGNDRSDLDFECNYYPACYRYSNIVTVGNMNKFGKRDLSSNKYSKVNYYAMGVFVSAISIGGRKIRMSGTSQAAAKVTGTLVNRLIDRHSSNGLTYTLDGYGIQTLDIVECAKWHDRCINIGK